MSRYTTAARGAGGGGGGLAQYNGAFRKSNINNLKKNSSASIQKMHTKQASKLSAVVEDSEKSDPFENGQENSDAKRAAKLHIQETDSEIVESELNHMEHQSQKSH